MGKRYVLTVRKVRNIKRFLRNGRHRQEIANYYRIHLSTVQKIAAGTIWAHVKLPEDKDGDE